MGARDGDMGASIDQGLIARVVAGVRYVVSGVAPDGFFTPAQPIAPIAQDQAEGRAFDFPVGYNLRMQPRAGEAVSFSLLRGLADGYDLLRLVIETRKDQIESFDWEIVPADEKQSADAFKGDIKRVSDFLTYPDKEHNWPQWLRMQVEDLLVVDAIAVYPRATRGGDLYGFELIDPGTLKRVIDDSGRTPLPPDPAYQQILKGIPAVDYSRDMLIYTMRNPRTNRIYGYSPVEQVMMTVNIALRRQISQLDFYTQGNVPEALAQVPENWTPKQLADFQLWWDAIMEGNMAQKRKMRFVPSLKDIVFPKKDVLKDEYDEWLARIICFAFSCSPSALIKQVNRASGEQMADTAKEEGLMPLLRFLEAHMTMLIQKYLKVPGLRFRFKVVNRVAPDQQAEIHKAYIDAEVITPDEVREELGMDAMTPEQREEAWPTPPPPGFNPDGTPILPKGATAAAGAPGDDPEPAVPAKKAPAEPSPAEKMLDKMVTSVLKKAEAEPAPPPSGPSPTEQILAESLSTYEKLLANALAQLDPERIAKVFAGMRAQETGTLEKMLSEASKSTRETVTAAVAAQPPTIVEHRPEIKVEGGDTHVHVQTPSGRGLSKTVKSERQADGSILSTVTEELGTVVGKRNADGSLTATTTFSDED